MDGPLLLFIVMVFGFVLVRTAWAEGDAGASQPKIEGISSVPEATPEQRAESETRLMEAYRHLAEVAGRFSEAVSAVNQAAGSCDFCGESLRSLVLDAVQGQILGVDAVVENMKNTAVAMRENRPTLVQGSSGSLQSSALAEKGKVSQGEGAS